jgi:predicted nucleotidyltransferase
VKYGLGDTSLKKINSIFEKFPAVEKVVLYGSRAKGNFRKGSDVDLTLLGNDLDFDVLDKIKLEFDDSSLPYKFDISIFSTLSDPDFLDHIKRVGVVFYEREK